MKAAPKPSRQEHAVAPPPRCEWQSAVARDLLAVASEYPQELVLGPIADADGLLRVELELMTDSLVRVPTAPTILPSEPFVISVSADDARPPVVSVTHERFLGVAHVMSGYELCLYLDPSREWDPAEGVRGLLARLWDWLKKVAGDEFDADTALFHAVGGVLHVTPGTPSVVVRDLPVAAERVNGAFLHRRTAQRLDLTATKQSESDLYVPVVRLRRDLPVGAGADSLGQLMARLDLTQRLWSPAALPKLSLAEAALLPASNAVRTPVCRPYLSTVLGPEARSLTSTKLAEVILTSVERNRRGSHQYVLLAVPHPNGGPHHLLCLRLKPELADQLRDLMATSNGGVDPAHVAAVSSKITMEWCRLSDERAAVTTRRDVGRPVTALEGAEVYLWGVGGLGSWLGEFVARAGARRIVVCDPGDVSGGLLVRQNYTETDIGSSKADALVRRLRAIRDDLDVDTLQPVVTLADLAGADLIIDATVSRSVTRMLDIVARAPGRRVSIAQVATDVSSGALGMLVVSNPSIEPPGEPDAAEHDAAAAGQAAPELSPTLTAVDLAAGATAAADSRLEPYRVLWREPVAGEEFVPTRGCSIPTFHGSAADLAALAGTLVNFIGLHLGLPESGTHLVALPHSGVSPAHHYLPHQQPAASLPEAA
jgi:hypothetical protein